MRAIGAGLTLAVLISAPGAAIATDGPPAERNASEFARIEEQRLLAAGEGEVAAIIDLARFYMASGLWVEAIARLRGVETREAELLSAECDYHMGRYGAVAARLERTAPESALRAIALAQLGAYDEAARIFSGTLSPEANPVPDFDFFIAKAESLAETGDADGAAKALSNISVDSSARKFVASKIRAARGEKAGAHALMKQAAIGKDEWAMRARIALAEKAGDVDHLQDLALEWRGGAFDRDLNAAVGRLRIQENDFDRGFRAYRLVTERFARSDAAIEAQDAIGGALPLLFSDQAGLHPKAAAELFFDYVEFAPPGAEGDALIREATEKLKALGLFAQAAALLDHQVFNRLRGAERAKIAADLAEIQMTAKKPEDALRIIRSTRIAGLDEETMQRRRRIEAKALADLGKTDNALALLSEASGGKDLLLRAEINWNRRAWTEAAEDYAASYSGDAARNEPAPGVAVRAATAFLLAGDRAGYRAFVQSVEKQLQGSPEGDLIRSLGDIDQERFLARFMNDYRRAFDRERS